MLMLIFIDFALLASYALFSLIAAMRIAAIYFDILFDIHFALPLHYALMPFSFATLCFSRCFSIFCCHLMRCFRRHYATPCCHDAVYFSP